MASLGLHEKGQTFKYILLTTKVVQVLQKFEKENQLKAQEKQILNRGAELIERIIEGALLVEGKEVDNLSPTLEGLSVYGYALSTIETLNLVSKAGEFTDFFKNLYTQLKCIEKEEKKSTKMDILKKFFEALGNAFRGDILKERYAQEYPILRRTTFNALSFA